MVQGSKQNLGSLRINRTRCGAPCKFDRKGNRGEEKETRAHVKLPVITGRRLGRVIWLIIQMLDPRAVPRARSSRRCGDKKGRSIARDPFLDKRVAWELELDEICRVVCSFGIAGLCVQV